MEWLLLRGTEVVIEDAFVIYKDRPNSRSGMAIMAESDSRVFRVDPQYAGTENDNFVINTINDLLPEIGLILRSYL